MREELEKRVEYISKQYMSGDYTFSPDIFDRLKAPDIAEIMMALDSEIALFLFKSIDIDLSAEIFPVLDEGISRKFLEELEPETTARLVNRMASDDAADLINLMAAERIPLVLERVSREDYRDIVALLKFDEESAGGIMAKELLVIREDITIGEAVDFVRDEARTVENIQNLYVVDREGVFLGIIPVVKLILENPGMDVSEVMDTDIEKVNVEMDQEKVAAIFSKYDLYSVAVVDGKGKLLGRITVDDIIDVIEEEANEDISRLAGTGDEEFWAKSTLRLSKARIPWLVAALFGGITAALVMSEFRESLESILSLAFFVPVIMAMGGNVGIQSSAVVVRELATGEFSLSDTTRKILRELRVSVLNGTFLGAILFIVVVIWLKDYKLATLLGLCLFSVVLWAALIGTSVPLLLNKINIDPALATGPFITTFNDILGIIFYLSIATLFLK
ncbi:MAG: magnesium transporter [Candidatus Krumholzibacteriota bacterium]|nr:magnesium transporter [Candidatus Krumholzibacteriota bacterium]